MSKETVGLLDDFGKYFDTYPSHDAIDFTTFITQFPYWHPGITTERVAEYARIMQNAMREADEDQRNAILHRLADANIMVQLGSVIEQYQEGEVGDLLGTLGTMYDKYKLNRGFKHVGYIDTPIKELMKDDFLDTGIKWRLHCLNSAMRPLRPGDFGLIAGRPDKGKTSFIASEISYMAPQLPEGRNVVWLNNEGKGARIIPRIWQAALGLNMTEMVALSNADKLEEQYLNFMGRFDKIRVIDIHGMNNAQVEMLIEANNAGIIVYDMIDNIGGFGDSARTDSRLESMYQWARERSVKYDCIGLATSQISAEGDGLQYPTLSMLKDSKTGKQGACDFQLMIGAVNDPNQQYSRFISLPKNKLQRPDSPKDPRCEVQFQPTRSRYIDVPLNPAEATA